MASWGDNLQEMEENFAMISLEEEEQGGITYEENAGELSEIDTHPRRRSHSIGSRWLRMGGAVQFSNKEEYKSENSGTEIVANEIKKGEKSGLIVENTRQDKVIDTGVNQGGKQIDGVIVNANLAVKGQDNKIQNTNTVTEGDNIVLVVNDPKRRRMDQDNGMLDHNTVDMDTQTSPHEIEVQNQKNGLLAGAAWQARHSS
ncbi:hypothetical protein POM88_030832 [Heracleum sosnowskyi]|uniref:Uncharacterized protein n=1 Tax=Heracleum sosnowskyi TaxID=360622 RepID=A0AAD8HXI8_9APIA|nr:hypothetical protein POM88_030832 [Heracleum sosnowskyi]